MRWLAILFILLLIPIVSAQTCRGYVKLAIWPVFAPPSSYVLPSVFGLSYCDGKIVYFRQDSCTGSQISSCTIAGDGCEGNSFQVPESSGAYVYYACVDKNGDNDFEDAGEQASMIYMVGYSSLSEFDWLGIVQIMVIASLVLILMRKDIVFRKLKN